MRKALATAAVAGAVALAPFAAPAAYAAEQRIAAPVLTQTDGEDVDEPLEQDGDDDTGKYGLIGLSGLFGLFGYKKYKDHKAARSAGTDGTSRRV